MKSLLLRPTRLVALVFAVVLTIVLGTVAVMAWMDFTRVEAVRSRVNRTNLLQQSLMILKEAELEVVANGSPPKREKVDAVRAHLAQIPLIGGPVGPVMQERLALMDELLTQAQTQPKTALPASLELVGKMLGRETRIELELLDAVYEYASLERRLALAALVGFPTLVVLALWALRQRLFRPIGNLKEFLSRLSDGDFAPVSLDGIDPLLLPLFQNYNQMVNRLEQLEQANRNRTLSLEQEVRSATQALLKQQQSLARAERLAAAGEVSATLAHELRNPIAGIEVTLVNLRRELADASLGERVDLVIAELHRITRLLNGLLQQSSHVPEAPRFVSVHRLVQELATLIRYQVPPHIRLETEVPEELRCRLPEDGVRQAVLNMVLNSVEALHDAPGVITIRVVSRDDMLHLQVIDDGPGFSSELLSGGVRPFVTSRESGTGLGLAIVKRFARDLGGELTIANRSPHGACVTMSLPHAEAHA